MKKIVSILLSSLIILMIVPNVFANTEICTLFEEDFTLVDGEDLTTHLKKQWPNKGGALIGNVWQNDNAILSTADDGKGGTALKVIVPSNKMPQIWTPSYTIPDSGKLYLAMRLNILDDGNTSDALRIHTASSTDKSKVTLYAQLNNGESIFTWIPWKQKPYAEENWYDIVTMYEKDEISGKTYVTLSVYNADGTLLGEAKAEHTESDAALHFGKYSNAPQTEYIVDDIKIMTEPEGVVGNPALDLILNGTSPTVTEVLPESAENLSVKPQMTFTFDQPVKESESFSIVLKKDSDSDGEYETNVAIAENTDFNGIVYNKTIDEKILSISFNNNLDANSKYQIKISGLTNVTGKKNMIEYTFPFETELAYEVEVTTDADGKLSVSQMEDGEGKVTATLPISEAPSTVDAIIIKYKGNQLVGIVDYFNDVSVADGNLQLKFIKPVLADGESFSIILFESTQNNFIPIASAINCKFIN